MIMRHDDRADYLQGPGRDVAVVAAPTSAPKKFLVPSGAKPAALAHQNAANGGAGAAQATKREHASAGILRAKPAALDAPSTGWQISASPTQPRAAQQRAAAHTAAQVPQQLSTKQQEQQAGPTESAAYQAHVKAWHDLLLFYRKNPGTLGFSYLVLAEPQIISQTSRAMWAAGFLRAGW